MTQYHHKKGPKFPAWQYKAGSLESPPDWVKKILHHEHGHTFATVSGKGVVILHDGDYIRLNPRNQPLHYTKIDFESQYEAAVADAYRHSAEVRAFRFYANTPTPKWLMTPFERGAVYYQGGEKPYLTVRDMENGPATPYVYEGDWLVRIDGHFCIYTDEMFRLKFTEL